MGKKIERASFSDNNRMRLGENVQKRAIAWRAANNALKPRDCDKEKRQQLIEKIDKVLVKMK